MYNPYPKSNTDWNIYYYLLTELAFRTVEYKDQGLALRTELARSMRKD